MANSKFENSFFSFLDSATKLAKSIEAHAILLMLENTVDWPKLKKKCGSVDFVVATHLDDIAEMTTEAEIPVINLDMANATVQDRLTQAVLDAVAHEHVKPGSTIVALYSNFDSELIDTITVLKLNERLGKLTARDLRKLETKVPLETMRYVVDLAVEIGRDGREGKAVGTMFVVGDHRKVVDQSKPAGFDPVKGYTRKERNISDSKVREAIKEIAQLDGMIIVSADGTLEAAARIIDTAPVEITMTSGLGSRHFAGAAISKNTKAIAVVVSQSSGTVRIFQNGEVVLRIEPMQRAMKWKDLNADTAPQPPKDEAP